MLKVKISPKQTLEAPPRTLVYGEPGIGKSTFASAAPDVVFICTEQGTNNLMVQRARVEDSGIERDPKTYEETILVLDSLIAGVAQNPKSPIFKNVVIDTVDALEKLIHEHVAKLGSKKSIADFKYGTGYDISVDHLKSVLSRCEQLQSYGVGIIMLAHQRIEMFNNPEGGDFNYYDIKAHKKFAGFLVEWFDNVLFARREQYSLEENGKIRGVGNGARFLSTQKTPTYVAKNRFSLPDKMPLSWSEYQRAMQDHKPADPADLYSAAVQIIKQLNPGDSIQAKQALDKISKDDARTLAQFLDFVKAKVTINVQPPKEETK